MPPPRPRPTPACLERRDALARIAAGAAAAVLTRGAAAAADAAPWQPSRPVTVVVPFGPGGIADLTLRAVAEAMAASLGQAVVVDNRPGAGAIAASTAVARAAPDGHTLLLASNGHAVSVGLFKSLPYDIRRDFAPIGTMAAFDLGIFAPASSRFATLAEAVAFARTRPGRLNVGTITPGSTQHLAARLFEAVAGIDVLVVPYKGTPALLAALRGGEVDLAFEIAGPWAAQVQAGAVRALAVTSSRPNPALPGVATVAQQGIAGYDVASWNALMAPADTPPAVLARLAETLRAALAAPAVQARLAALGAVPLPGAPAALRALLASETARWGDVIRRSRIEPE